MSGAARTVEVERPSPARYSALTDPFGETMMLLDPTSRIPLESLPVFPLPNTVMLPEQQLPLHIFEPRYRQMVRDALESSPYIVVARITGEPGAEPANFERVATAGKIVAHQRLADGRFNILVEGSVRVAVDEIASMAMYRRVRCEAMAEPHGAESQVPTADTTAMLSLVGYLMQIARARTPGLEFKPPPDLDAARLAFRVADRMVADARWRQRILEAESAQERVTRTTSALVELLDDLGAVGIRARV